MKRLKLYIGGHRMTKEKATLYEYRMTQDKTTSSKYRRKQDDKGKGNFL